MGGYVYILASKRDGTLYTGVTADMQQRMWEHKDGLTPGFTSRYGVKRLVWYDFFPDIRDAIAREKRIKKWPRQWKIDLILQMNPDWDDLTAHFLLG